MQSTKGIQGKKDKKKLAEALRANLLRRKIPAKAKKTVTNDYKPQS